METKLIEVIYTVSTTGEGTKEDPNRFIHELWTKDGKLLARQDDWKEESSFNWREIENNTHKNN